MNFVSLVFVAFISLYLVFFFLKKMGQQRGKKEIILETSPINLWGTIFGNLKTLITRNRNLLKLANFVLDVKKKTITNWPKLHVPLQLLTVRVIFDI